MIRKPGLVVLLVAGGAGVASAHTPICDCYDNGDDTITCEGGFSDGGTAVGIAMRIVDTSGRVLIEGAMSDNSDFTFARPDVDFLVEFEGGEGHVIKIDGRDIEE
jgi:hypothetical protein